jgi:hypothetical protein
VDNRRVDGGLIFRPRIGAGAKCIAELNNHRDAGPGRSPCAATPRRQALGVNANLQLKGSLLAVFFKLITKRYDRHHEKPL